MASYLAGAATGCLVGVSATFLMLILSSIIPEPHPITERYSIKIFATVTIAVLAITSTSYLLGLTQAVTVLFLLFSVLAIAEVIGMTVSLVAAGVGALALSIWFLPPIGSPTIGKPTDRLLVALFLIGAMIFSRKKSIEGRF